MKLSCRFLSDDERRRIHDDSVKILWEVGVEFRSDKALKILSDAGAIVDEDAHIARIPEEMVDR